MSNNILGIKDISLYFGISESEVRKLVRENKIPYFRLGNRLKFNMKTIQEWVESLEKLESKNSVFY